MKFRVFRYNPEVDSAPRYQDYDVPLEPTDRMLLDALMRSRINGLRKQSGFEPISEEIRTLEFAETLGVGSTHIASAKFIPVTQ